ncbi:MAG TPA: thiamine pyrophosphate-binding protein [Candidatus Deferrimicrobium sp.]|nr:thiamine pyrophosphate-binding protein [Candidatus Deferrimicrobium sp.]
MAEKKKESVTGGDLLVKALVNENVRFIFGIPGGQLLPIYDAIYRWGREQGIDTIMMRHEQAAAHAADAWARVTNTIGVCMGTVGPGATHMVPGVAAAFSDSSPILVITPQVISRQIDIGAVQGDVDQLALFHPIVKFQKQIRNTERIPEYVQKAFREAVLGRPRPVHLDIPADVLGKTIQEEIICREPYEYRPLNNPAADPTLIEQTVTALLNAEKPLIIAGGGIVHARAAKELYEFAEYLKIPVIATVMGSSAIMKGNSTYIGLGVFSSNGLKAIHESDLILAFGTRFSVSLGYGKPPAWPTEKNIIQIDIDPTEIGKNRPISLGILGDCKTVLQQILTLVKQQKPPIEIEHAWLSGLKQAREKFWKGKEQFMNSDEIPIRQERLVHEVDKFLDEDAILIIDGGDISLYSLEQLQMEKPRKLLQSVGMGHLGTSIPYAIGAKLAAPDRQVCTVSGDGSFLMNIQELDTARRLNLPFICVISNNSAWGQIKSGQKYYFKKRFIDTDLPDTNFAEIAKAFGCYGERVTNPNEIRAALERAKASNQPAVLDIITKFTTHDISKLGLSRM